MVVVVVVVRVVNKGWERLEAGVEVMVVTVVVVEVWVGGLGCGSRVGAKSMTALKAPLSMDSRSCTGRLEGYGSATEADDAAVAVAAADGTVSGSW